MNNKILIFTILSVLLASCRAGFCQTTNSKQNLFLVQNQNRILSLSNFIRGNDLDFALNDSSKAQIKQTFSKVDSVKLTFNDGFTLLDFDMLTQLNDNKYNSGVIIAFNGDKSIQVADAEFQSGASLPIISKYRTPYTLPEIMRCFNGLITDQSFTVTVNCQSKSGEGQSLKDYVCSLKQDQADPICFSSDAPSQINTRISKLKTEKGTITTIRKLMSVDILPDGSTLDSVIKVYNIAEDKIQLQSTITKEDLGLDSLRIADLDIDKQNRIVFVSNKEDGNFDLISFSYYNGKPNDLKTLVSAKGVINSIKIDSADRILMASPSALIEATYDRIKVLVSYPLDSTDNIITGIQANSQYLIAISSTQTQYVWKRGNNKFLHHKGSIRSQAVYLQPYSNSQLVMRTNQIVLNQITTGYLWVQGTAQDSVFTLIGRSDNITCQVQFSVKFVQNNDQIFMKKNFTSQKFSLKSTDQLSIPLSDYFGGKDLSYQIAQTDPSLKIGLRQIKRYTINNGLTGMDLYQVVGVSQSQFYIAGIKDKTIVIKFCTKSDAASFDCTDYSSYDQLQGISITIDGIRRYNGDKLISFCQQDHKYAYFNLDKPFYKQYYTVDQAEYSQVKIGQKFTFFTLKLDNQVAIRFDSTYTTSFGKQAFSSQQFKLIGGFYPKSVKPSPSNPNIFYVKTHRGVLSMGVNENNRILVPLKYTNILDEYLNQQLWDFVVGKQTILVIRPNFLKQYSIAWDVELHSIQLGQGLVLPVHYDEVTDTVVARTENGKIVMLRLNSGSADYLLHQQQFADQKVTMSWGWFVAPDSSTAYLVPKFDQLSISADISDDEFKKDFNISLKVMGQPQVEPINVNSNVVFINYPVKIKELSDDKNVINLPSNSNDQISIVQFPMQNYFSGWINDYEMVCSFAQQKKLQLLTPLRYKGENPYDFQGPALDMVSGDNFTVLLDSNQTLLLVDQNNKQLASLNIQDIGADCQKIAILSNTLQGNSLFVYCIDTKTYNQMIQKFILSSNSITKSVSFAINPQFYSKFVSQIRVIPQKSQNSYWFFVHDVDKLIDTNDKQGTVKVLSIQNNEFSIGQTISSVDFGIQPAQPINGMDIHDGTHWMMSIGGAGIGYVSIDSLSIVSKNSKHYYRQLDGTTFQFINLKDNQSIQRYMLDDNLLQSIKVLSIDGAGNAKVFISSTSSLHMVLALSLNAQAKLVNVAETYNRMSNLPSINWAYCSETTIILAYYNTSSKTQAGKTLVGFYNRSENGIINSYITLAEYYDKYQRRNNFIAVPNHKNLLIIDVVFDSVSHYRFDEPFALKLSYDAPGSFKTIKFIARNGLSQISHNADVSFDNLPDGQGLKWYWVVLIVIVVLIVVGVAVGYYQRIKAKRDKKKISLVTQQDEQV